MRTVPSCQIKNMSRRIKRACGGSWREGMDFTVLVFGPAPGHDHPRPGWLTGGEPALGARCVSARRPSARGRPPGRVTGRTRERRPGSLPPWEREPGRRPAEWHPLGTSPHRVPLQVWRPGFPPCRGEGNQGASSWVTGSPEPSCPARWATGAVGGKASRLPSLPTSREPGRRLAGRLGRTASQRVSCEVVGHCVRRAVPDHSVRRSGSLPCPVANQGAGLRSGYAALSVTGCPGR